MILKTCPRHGETLVVGDRKLQCPVMVDEPDYQLDGPRHPSHPPDVVVQSPMPVDCGYTAPLPADLEMRAAGAAMLPGFGEAEV